MYKKTFLTFFKYIEKKISSCVSLISDAIYYHFQTIAAPKINRNLMLFVASNAKCKSISLGCARLSC